MSSPSVVDRLLHFLDPIIPDVLLEKSKARKAAAALKARQSVWSDQVDSVATAYGLGRILGYEHNGIVRIQLDYAVAYMHLSQVVPLQLVRAACGFAALNPHTQQFEKSEAWGKSVVDPNAACVEQVFSFGDRATPIAVRTPYGRGVLVGHSRRDGIVAAKIDNNTIVYSEISQIVILGEADAASSSSSSSSSSSAFAPAPAAAAASSEEALEPSAESKKGKKGKK